MSFTVPVPAILTDEHLRVYSENQLKVILFLIGAQGEACKAGKLYISKALKLAEDEVEDALLFWETTGIIRENTDSEEPEKFIPSDKADSNVKQITLQPEQAPSKPTPSEIADRIKENPDLEILFRQAQLKLGKTPGYNGQATLLFLLDHYGLPIEVLFMLLEYCVSIGKTNFQYIEQVGKDWGTNEIDTIEKAAERINKLNNANANWAEVAKYAGLSNPKPTKSQTDYLSKWLGDMNFSLDMVFRAYDTAVEKTGKINWKYMDKILTGWFTKGILKAEDIDSVKSAVTTAGGALQNKETSYSLEEFSSKLTGPIKYERKGK